MNNVKQTAKRQLVRLLDKAAMQLDGLKQPQGGWVRAMRHALGMSAPDLAQRMGVTKAAIYQAERKERDGGITIRHMENLADALGGKFVYAIVPDGSIEDIVGEQAREKARALVHRAGAHMALEQQSPPDARTAEQIDRLASEFTRDPPPTFWKAR